MSHDPSRKRFLAKVLGLAAAGALAPGALAAAAAPGPAKGEGARKAAFRVQPQPRAVARSGGAA